jgi:hypothetical protein
MRPSLTSVYDSRPDSDRSMLSGFSLSRTDDMTIGFGSFRSIASFDLLPPQELAEDAANLSHEEAHRSLRQNNDAHCSDEVLLAMAGCQLSASPPVDGDGVSEEIAGRHPSFPPDIVDIKEYSGFEVAINKLEEKQLESSVVKRELDWQGAVGSDVSKQLNFKDQVLQQQHFRAFALMRTNSPYVTICHSIGKFFPKPEVSNGKYIGFIGDRTSNQDPVPFVLPDTVWKWTAPNVHKSIEDITKFYEQEGNYGKLFTQPLLPDDDSEEVAKEKKEEDAKVGVIEIPYMLSLPSVIVAKLFNRARWMPHELLAIIDESIVHFYDSSEEMNWTVMREWCLAATQLRDPKGCSSVLGVKVDEVTHVVDETFREWIDTRLDMTMEVRRFPIVPSPCKTRKVEVPENGRTTPGDEAKKMKKKRRPPRRFGADAIESTDHDILFGRGGCINSHPGNLRFRHEVLKLRPWYHSVDSKAQKRKISMVLLEAMKNENRRFLQKLESDGLWHEVDDYGAQLKANQALRERIRL